jgi:hypothetical protein
MGRGYGCCADLGVVGQPGVAARVREVVVAGEHELRAAQQVHRLDRLAGDLERVAQPDVTRVDGRERDELGVGHRAELDDE